MLKMDEMMESTVSLIHILTESTTSATAAAATSFISSPVFTNSPLISALTALLLAQFAKLFTFWYKERRWDFKRLIGSGGMPSSHSASVTALAVAIGLQEGFGGSPFATALIFACVVMYDATGVRLQAGRQAEVLNQIVCELPAEHPLAESRPLRELLGHTPAQVMTGGCLGIITAAIIVLITGFITPPP